MTQTKIVRTVFARWRSSFANAGHVRGGSTRLPRTHRVGVQHGEIRQENT